MPRSRLLHKVAGSFQKPGLQEMPSVPMVNRITSLVAFYFLLFISQIFLASRVFNSCNCLHGGRRMPVVELIGSLFDI